MDYLNPFNYYYGNISKAKELEEKERELNEKNREHETLNQRLDRWDKSNRGLNPGDNASDYMKGM